jgi:hypothetical protein
MPSFNTGARIPGPPSGHGDCEGKGLAPLGGGAVKCAMDTAMSTNEPPLACYRPWAKPRAMVAVVFAAFFTFVSLKSLAAPSEPLAHFIIEAMLAIMWALALRAVLGLRARTLFSATGVADVGVLRTSSLPWELVTDCTVVEKTLRVPKAPSVHGVLVRFTSRQADRVGPAAGLRPRDRVIELFVPDAAPLAPGILALLRTIPQLSQAPWNLLDPNLRREARAPDRKHP